MAAQPITTQEIPYSQNAEEAALGAVLSYGAYAEDIMAAAPPGDYFVLRNRYVAQAIQKCLDEKQPVDMLLITNTLRDMGKLEEAGGFAYLTGLVNNTPNSANGLTYARMVHRAALRRQALESFEQLKTLALNTDKSIEDIIAAGEKVIGDIADRTPFDHLRTMKDAVHSVLDNMDLRVAERTAGGSGLAGLSTGILGLDKLLNGLQGGKLYLVGGRLGMGKTALLLFILLQIAKLPPKADGKPYRVYLWSGEMGAEEIALRLVANASNVDSHDILSGKLEIGTSLKAVYAGAHKVSGLNIWVDETVRMTPRKLRRNIIRWARANGGLPDMIGLDYTQLMHPDKWVANRTDQLMDISRSLKELAREFNRPVMELAQLNRNPDTRDDHRPELHDFAYCDGLAQDADAVLFPYFPMYYADSSMSDGSVDIIVKKHRGGRTGTVNVWADFALNTYTEDWQ